jgi:hypothetical protein
VGSVSVSEVVLDETPPIVIINNLRISDNQLYEALKDLDEEERKEYVARSLSTGSNVLQMMNTTARVDYVRSEFDRIKDEFCNEMEKNFSDDGQVSRKFQEFFGEKGTLAKMLDDHFGENGSVIYKILNPKDETTPLGKFAKQLEEELDASKEGTAFFELKRCVEEGFNNIIRELSATEARLDERDKSPAKGLDFEQYVYEYLDVMARDFEDTVEFVGEETGPHGKVGDVVVTINKAHTRGLERRIVLEAKKRNISLSGKGSFLLELDKAKENRLSHYAIGAVHESNTPKPVGALRRYDGAKMICGVTEDEYPLSLEIAYKMARSELILETAQEELEIDTEKVLGKIQEIETHLQKTRSIKTSLSGAVKDIDNAKDCLKEMEASIKETLKELDELVRT